MGRKIVVTGADFSVNGIFDGYEWFLNFPDIQGNSTFASSLTKYVILPSEISKYDLIGKVVNSIKCYAATAGTISIGNVTCSSTDNVGSSDVVVDNYNYSVVQGENIILLTNPITLSLTNSLWVSGPNILKYNANTSSWAGGYNFRAVSANSTNAATSRIPIDFGFYHTI